ncbi:MAG: restriction endonuclease subunit R, partial [Lachnospiraceae bacterium]|nr:restriction endonuclease subunit R [Lachnospiraceae bacterium]
MENKRTDEVSALQKRIRFLEEENRRLTKLLEAAGIDYGIEPERKPSEPFDPDQGARIKPYEVKDSYPKQFFDIFCTGRRDVFVLRHTGQDGKVGYYPQCHNRWDERCHRKRKDKVKCKDCEIQSYKFLGYGYIKNHMIGASPVGNDVVAIYPMLPGNMCKFLVFDFDNHEKDAERNDFANTNDDWKEEVNALWDVCDA